LRKLRVEAGFEILFWDKRQRLTELGSARTLFRRLKLYSTRTAPPASVLP
jgi:hypothetical protein